MRRVFHWMAINDFLFVLKQNTENEKRNKGKEKRKKKKRKKKKRKKKKRKKKKRKKKKRKKKNGKEIEVPSSSIQLNFFSHFPKCFKSALSKTPLSERPLWSSMASKPLAT